MTSGIVRRRGGPQDIQDAWRTLAGGADLAARTLLDVAENSESDAARNQAAMAILDRVGISARPEVTVRVVPQEYNEDAAFDGTTSPGEVVRRRLAELSAVTRAEQERMQEQKREEDLIVDAELVEG